MAAQKPTFTESQSFAVNQGQTNFPEFKYENTEKNKSPNKKTVTCFYCDKMGHIAPECRTKKRDSERKSSNRNWNLPNKYEQNKNYSRQNNNDWKNDSQTKESSQANENERPQGNRSQPNSDNNIRPTYSTHCTPAQYNKPYGNREFDNTNRNRSDNYKSNDKNFRVIREDEVDWDEIAPAGRDVCGTGN